MEEEIVKKYCNNWEINKGSIQSANLQNPIQDINLNEPRYIKSLLYFLSTIYKVEVNQVSEILWKNFQRAFCMLKL